MNIAEILKNCPVGTQLYCSLMGPVRLTGVGDLDDEYPISISSEHNSISLTADGKYYNNDDGECMLFPSKDNHDWDTFKPVIQFRPYDKVLIRDSDNEDWCCGIFSDLTSYSKPYRMIGGTLWKQCIPYNENTRTLIGTSNAGF